jgi:hypothetical protein
MPDQLFASPGDTGNNDYLSKPMETTSLAKPKYMDQNSLAASNEYLSVVVGGRGSQNFDIKSPDPRLMYPG